ncbi:hypothetical protein HYU14_07095 [Candidatus Woesearchaeota archaeon]|nr:hypothetical protein [Candidatus Woesearchaeota archaeon]
MGEHKIPETRIKFKDVFSLKNLYQMMHEHLLEEGWAAEGGGAGTPIASNAHAFVETLYSENFYQKGLHAGGKELWVYWRLARKPEGRYTGYFKYKLNIDFHGTYLQDREIVHQGKKINVQAGEIEIFFNASLITDYNHDWDHHWFLKHFKEFYEHRIIHQEIEKYDKLLWKEVYRISNMVKKYLDLRTFLPTPEPIYPKMFGMSEE